MNGSNYLRIHENFVKQCLSSTIGRFINKTENEVWLHTSLFTKLSEFEAMVHEKEYCSAEGEINKKRDALSELAFCSPHRNHSLWLLTIAKI